jgi:alpha-beta hydrolase superfamily lysophospholipase
MIEPAMGEVSAAAIRTHDGLTLAAEDHVLSGARAHVVVVHGFGEHRGRYAHVAAALTAAGYACHLFDVRGHGASEGARGHVGRFDDFLDDLGRVAAHVRTIAARSTGARAGDPRLVLLGHSLGGLIALDHEIHRPGLFAALVVSSPFVAPAFRLSWPRRVAAGVLGRLLPALRLRTTLEGRWLSHDPDVVRAYAADPGILRHITLGLWREIERAQRRLLERAGEIRLPALFLVSGSDRVVNAALTYEVFRRLGSDDKRLLTYDGYFHEVLNEVGKVRVLDDLRGWLQARCSG